MQLGIAAPSALLVGGGYSITGAAYRDHSTRPFHRYKKAGVTFLDPLLLDQPDDFPHPGTCVRSISSMRASAAERSASARQANGKAGAFGGNYFATLHNGLERVVARLKPNPTASKDPFGLPMLFTLAH